MIKYTTQLQSAIDRAHWDKIETTYDYHGEGVLKEYELTKIDATIKSMDEQANNALFDKNGRWKDQLYPNPILVAWYACRSKNKKQDAKIAELEAELAERERVLLEFGTRLEYDHESKIKDIYNNAPEIYELYNKIASEE